MKFQSGVGKSRESGGDKFVGCDCVYARNSKQRVVGRHLNCESSVEDGGIKTYCSGQQSICYPKKKVGNCK